MHIFNYNSNTIWLAESVCLVCDRWNLITGNRGIGYLYALREINSKTLIIHNL